VTGEAVVNDSMRAVWYERQGSAAEVLQAGQMPVPSPGPGEVRVRVHASGVNPSDTYGRAGRFAPMQFPRVVPHQDGAGVIDAVGAGIPPARVGERVWVFEATWGRPFGTAAEYVVVPAGRAVRLPDGVTYAEGACLGVPALTAHRCVFADGPVGGQTVLVTGGAGAVGRYAIQWAKWGGASPIVATVSSEAKAETARSAGADWAINYRQEDVAEIVERLTGGVNRIIEVDLGGNLAATVRILRPYGTIAAYASHGATEPIVPWLPLMRKNATVQFVLVYAMPETAKAAAIADIAAAAAEGALTHAIGARYPLEQAAAAHETVEAGSVIGNVVLEIGGEPR
jgi:NADPH2:quinone reductase